MPKLDPEAVNLFSEDFVRCPQQQYAEMHAKCPVARVAITNS